MKNLKHIQIFEAFESRILSKTLGYINTSDKSNFMDRIKRLCKTIDFPLSKMSDEYFEYLLSGLITIVGFIIATVIIAGIVTLIKF